MSFPTRPQLSDFGPITLLNAGAVRDPDRQATAEHWNLIKNQVAGMGLLSPLVAVKFEAFDPIGDILARSEVWNPQLQTGGSFAAPVPERVSAGRYTLTYPETVPNHLGEEISLAFSWAFAFHHADPPTTIRKVQACPVGATPNVITVICFDATDTLDDGNTIWVFAG